MMFHGSIRGFRSTDAFVLIGEVVEDEVQAHTH